MDADCELAILGWSLTKGYFRQQGRKGVLESITARDKEVGLLKKQLADTKLAFDNGN